MHRLYQLFAEMEKSFWQNPKLSLDKEKISDSLVKIEFDEDSKSESDLIRELEEEVMDKISDGMKHLIEISGKDKKLYSELERYCEDGHVKWVKIGYIDKSPGLFSDFEKIAYWCGSCHELRFNPPKIEAKNSISAGCSRSSIITKCHCGAPLEYQTF